MTLSEAQRAFALQAAKLIVHIYEVGYEVSLGEAWRSPETAAANAKAGTGIVNSLHIKKLAIDLNLFKDGIYLSTSEAHRPFGEWWEKQHPLARWGGRFKRPDGNHYSFEWGGVQ